MRTPPTSTRRTFLAAAATVATAAHLESGQAEAAPADRAISAAKLKGRLAMASYSLRKFDLDEALAKTKRLGLSAICLKSFHLPLDSTPEQIANCVARAKEAGITLYGGGVINMKNEPEVDHAFEYARAAGMSRIIGSPAPEVLPRVDEKVREYDIEVCIHNHGPGDANYATPEIAYEKIAHLDRRVGFCHDVGHTKRFGADPIELTRKYADRILDLHFKDVTEATKKGHAIACGRGVIDLPALLRVLIDIGYEGYLAFEYEPEANDPLPGLAESVGYVRGVLDQVSAQS